MFLKYDNIGLSLTRQKGKNMVGQNRRLGEGGKSLVNLGKALLSAIIVSAVILNENAIAARRKSSKTTSKKGLRSASSKKSNSAKSTSKKDLRSASSRSNSRTGATSGRSSRSSKRAATASAKVSNIRGLSSYSNSTYGNTTNYSYANVSDITSLISDLTSDLSSFNSEMKTLSQTMNDYANKMSDFETRLAKLEAGSVVTTQNVPLATSSTTTSDGKLGYIKGSADLCKPDSSGHKYCSVAINVDKKYDNGAYCFAWNFYDKMWHMNQNLHTVYTVTGQHIDAYEFSKGKPSLFAMTDFSYYTDLPTKENSRFHDGKTVLLCGDAIGPSDHNGTQIFDGELLNKNRLVSYLGSHIPFTHSDGSMILFNASDGVPLLKYNMKQNLLEYKPNLSESYIKALRTYSGNDYFDVRGNKYSKLDW